jgi:uncharacterized membrane protein
MGGEEMAYCKSCGAYIPDGLSACLACGYDEASEQAASAVKKQSSPKEKQNDDVREVMDRHRRLQQEKNRQWAEKEKERRDRQKENRRWAQEEYAKRQAEREVEAEQRRRDEEQRRREAERQRAEHRRSTAGSGAQTSPGAAVSAGGNRALAAASYLGVLFALPFFFTPDDAFAKFHARQGLKLFLFTLVTRILKYITPFGWIFTLIHLYFIYKGASNALNGKKEPLPYIGTIGDK